MIDKLVEGFKLLHYDDKHYITFLDRTTSLILTLIYKLKVKLHLDNISLEESKSLNKIYEIYNESVKKKHQIRTSNIDDFRDKLLKNYIDIYINKSHKKLEINSDLIDYFIGLDEVSNIDLVTLHNIVLYSDTIEKEKLDKLVRVLIKNNRYNNNYYEFFKLKIVDRIIQKYINLKIESSSNEVISEIIAYIEKNNIMSHLMSMYAKIYLSLSLYLLL